MSVIASTIDGRYQVITRIASGGMGEVYRAHDAVLGREVALKVLHPQFAGDRGFVDRFRREARAAAILNHPSIVGVYDWGETEGTYFMIMEFVRGMNLRGLLSQYGRLEPAQVVEVALPVLSALEHAHGHGIVHRDVKPENILISEDGTVKVADFGLARAYADSYVSQAEGTVTGTVQYLAPEQIQGQPADPRTDLYALGVVLFECLTGRPPFTGETSLAIAYQHLSQRIPAPSSAVPTVGPGLDQVVVRATSKDRAERPASARAMKDEISRAAVGLPAAIPLRDVAAQIPSAEFVPEERATTVTIPRAVSPRARRRRRLRWIGLALALVAVLAGGAFATWVYAIPHYTDVPRVAGLSVRVAQARLKAAGLDFKVADAQFSHDVPAGDVIQTAPDFGARIRKHTTVVVYPSKGQDLLPIPDVHGDPQGQATRILKDAGFVVTPTHAFNDSIAKNSVISQKPDAQAKVERGSPVTIVISDGPPPVRVPNVVGQPSTDAEATLENLGFQVKETNEYSTTVPKDDVISTDPAVGVSPPKGSPVTVVVSKGPQTFAMPDVRGMTREAATSALEKLGLVVEAIGVPNNNPPDTVVFQDPAPGTTVKQGDTVTIYVTSQ